MATEIKVPELPESVSEATVGEWQKNKGDGVQRDENLVDLETDKVVLEVPAVADGVLSEIKVQPGDTVSAGDVLGLLDEGATAAAGDDDAASKTTPEAADTEQTDTAAADAAPAASPAAQKLMAENDIAAADVEGSGKDKRITKADVVAVIDQRQAEPRPAATASGNGGGDDEQDIEQVDRRALAGAPQERLEQRVPMTRIRARIAERLLDVSQNTAMLTTFNEVDMQQVIDTRARYKEQFEKSHDVRLGFMSFFVKAAVEALKRFPIVNASIDAGDIVYHGYYDIGVAVSSPRGLLVPVLRDADQMSYATVESTIRDLGQRAQNGKITMDELTGGTFTITNGGVFGSWLSTPIINPPQAAILGMHATKERPVVIDGEIVIRPMMMLALSYDHRLVDGRDAVLFLRTIKELLEDPARLLLQI